MKSNCIINSYSLPKNSSGDSCGSVVEPGRGFLGVTGGAGDVSGLDGGLTNVAGGLGFRGGRSKQKKAYIF